MNSFNGTYIKSIWRNEKTGYSQFIVSSKGNVLVCEGVIPNLPYKTPLFLLCNREKDENGEMIYKIKSIKLSAFNRLIMLDFIKTRYFYGIGPHTAEAAMKLFGDDLFKYIDNHYHEEITKTKDISILKLMRQLKELIAQERVISFFGRLECPYFYALKVYNRYGIDAIEEIYKNPYILLEYGVQFSKCEEMAQKRGFLACDKNRVEQMVRYIIKRNKNNGNTRINIYELEKQFHALEAINKKKSNNLYTNRVFIAEALAGDDYIVTAEDEKIYVYSKDDYTAEQKVVDNIIRLSKTSSSYEVPDNIADVIEKKLGIKYSKEQKDAFNGLYTSGIKIITGGPGTGKTTLLNGLLTAYEMINPDAKIMLCAPTGCAAVRMYESTNRFATTIHKALGIRPYSNFTENMNKLDSDCIVVDESSMIDTYLFNALLSSIKNGATLYLLGDKDQLPSIGVGDILKDLLTSHVVESYELSHIFRQSEENLIVKNSHNVIIGDINLKSDKSFQIRRFSDEKSLLNELEKISYQCKNRKIENYKVYTPSRNVKFETGSIKINRMMQKVNFAGSGIRYGYYRFGFKDKVLFNKNNYEKGYYNGEEGYITDVQKIGDNIYITVKTDEGEDIHLSNMEIDDIDLGYAITAHKSQGSECDNAVIVIPQNPRNMLKRKLLYVEITRARKNVIILTEGDALEKCIGTYSENIRDTGLLWKLSKCFEI